MNEQVKEDWGMVMAVGQKIDQDLADYYKREDAKDRGEWQVSIVVACGVLVVLAMIFINAGVR